MQEKGRVFRESFLSKLQLLLRGTVAAPPERFGETLADEHIRGGCCASEAGCSASGNSCTELQWVLVPAAAEQAHAASAIGLLFCDLQPPLPAPTLALPPSIPAGGAFVGPDNKPVIVSEHLPNAHMRLFGGAQYHRAMAEFRAGVLARTNGKPSC